jgi:transketolase
VERSFEQIKIDFGYQELGGNFVSVGNSYDYASLGCTHHCPGDVGVLKNIPNMQIILPGTSSEFDLIFKQTYANNMPTYFRLSERENPISVNVSFGKANVLQTGKLATVIAVGTALHATYEAIKGLDVTLLYYTTVSPFDAFTLKNNLSSNKVILCEPYYEGVLAAEIYKATKPKPISLDCIGVPHRFITKYGKAEDIDKHTELTTFHIKKRIKEFIY